MNPARDVQMSGEIYKYRAGYTHVGEFYKWNDKMSVEIHK